MLRSSIFRRLCDKKELLLEEYAKRTNNTLLSKQFAEYVKAKEEFDFLLEKYAVFGSKEKSVSDAAQLVGLKLPSSPSLVRD